jgi:PAS domain S-box-containing protein
MHATNLTSVIEVLEALEGTETAAWAWDIGTDSVRWSANTGPLFGLERGHQPAADRASLSHIHPDDRAAVEEALRLAIAEGAGFDMDFRTVWPDGSVRWLNGRGQVVCDAAGAPRRLVGVMSDVTARKRRAEQDRFLAISGDLLSRSLDIDETVSQIARLLVVHLADWCVVQLIEDGLSRHPTVSHRDPEKMALSDRLQSEYPPPPEPTGLGAQVVAERQGVLIANVTDEVLAAEAVDERHLEIMRSLGLRSAMVVPLRARDRVLGLMTLVCAESGYRFGDDDLKFAEDFGRRAGLAIENARLLEEAREARKAAERAADRLQLLQNVIARLSVATSLDEVAEAAVERGSASTGADRGALVLYTDTGPAISGSWGYTDERLAAIAPALSQPGPLTDAMTHGLAVYCESVEDLVERYPNLEEVMRPVAEGAFVALPLYGSTSLLGSLGLVYAQSNDFSPELRSFFGAMARHVGVAVERSRLFERLNTVADTLQAALAPPPVRSCSHLEATGFYRAAGVGDVGGDWYDVVETPRGTHMYVIGDVVGRGLEAVAAMSQLRQSTRLLVSEGRSPAQITAALGTLAGGDGAAFASTVLLAEVDAATGRITLASAGHLPPVLVSGDSATRVQPPLGPPLGVGPQPTEDHVFEMRAGECLVMYTDGVIERRHEDIETSLSGLCDRLAKLGPVVGAISDELGKMAEAAQDDATVVVFSLREPPCEPEVP